MTRSTHPDEASARSRRNRRRSPARTFSYCKGRFFPSPTEVTLATVTAYPPPRKSHEKHHPLAMRRAHRRHHLVEGIRGLLRATRAIALLQGRSSSAVHDTAHAARRGSQAVTGQIRQGLRRARGGVKKKPAFMAGLFRELPSLVRQFSRRASAVGSSSEARPAGFSHCRTFTAFYRFLRHRQRTRIEAAQNIRASYLSAATTASKNGTTGNVPLPAGSVCAPQTTMTTFSLRLM